MWEKVKDRDGHVPVLHSDVPVKGHHRDSTSAFPSQPFDHVVDGSRFTFTFRASPMIEADVLILSLLYMKKGKKHGRPLAKTAGRPVMMAHPRLVVGMSLDPLRPGFVTCVLPYRRGCGPVGIYSPPIYSAELLPVVLPVGSPSTTTANQ
ncbi:hypothetical protein PGT21_012896 [Puccinia graminis f. sp. tritici]|uniref:Uncharacterized protein n=1 Tax=Puccinia graminis f. sp. tritici TaxID=56615 RepID=A0A5B0MMU0_PUCGR|nr:hypothetical protein PGT21_012896 [Puccinia graminis f. sp. tritici]